MAYRRGPVPASPASNLPSECANVSNLSEGRDALDQLDERVRRLAETLNELGWDQAFHQLADQLPDARERLDYVGQMTEAAATKVLNMVDAAQPLCQSAAADALQVADRLVAVGAQAELSADQARAALADAADTLRHLAGMAKSQCSVLSDIMMAQDFQDLSGQVIKKVVLIISHTEQQLVQLLAQSEGTGGGTIEFNKLEGPQVPDKAVGQSDVDDLLASMGF